MSTTHPDNLSNNLNKRIDVAVIPYKYAERTQFEPLPAYPLSGKYFQIDHDCLLLNLLAPNNSLSSHPKGRYIMFCRSWSCVFK
jgi:hypothetical protein